MLYEFMCLWNEPIKAWIVSTQTCLATYVQVCICSGWQVNSNPKVIACSLGFLSSPWQLPLYDTKHDYKARLVSQRGMLSRNPGFSASQMCFSFTLARSRWQLHLPLFFWYYYDLKCFSVSSRHIRMMKAWQLLTTSDRFMLWIYTTGTADIRTLLITTDFSMNEESGLWSVQKKSHMMHACIKCESAHFTSLYILRYSKSLIGASGFVRTMKGTDSVELAWQD